MQLVRGAITEFADGIVDALPEILAGFVFLAIAAVLVKVVLFVVRLFVRRAVQGESPVYRQFIVTIVAAFLWFAVILSFLSIIGLDGIATSLGTAAGFVALGVSYATSGMIADAVAGVYLLRDPDFMPGDTVEVGGTEGVVRSIELRKTRLTVGDDVLVRGNAEIEKKWTKLGEDAARALDGEEIDDPADESGG